MCFDVYRACVGVEIVHYVVALLWVAWCNNVRLNLHCRCKGKGANLAWCVGLAREPLPLCC